MNRFVKRENIPPFDDFEWRAIDGFEDYSVHPRGFVMSKKTSHNKRSHTTTVVYKILTIFSVKGYSAVNLVTSTNGEETRKSVRVHRLVANAFIDKIEGKNYVNHKDGNKRNSDISNLEWVTSSENELHSYRVLGKKNKAGLSKMIFSKDDIINIRNMYNSGHKQADICNKYNCNQSTISLIVRNKTYRGEEWE